MESIRVKATSKKKRDLQAKTKKICRTRGDTRLWCILLFAVTLYCIVWIPTLFRIPLKEPGYQRIGQAEADLGDLRSSHRVQLVGNTSSPSFSSDTPVANSVNQIDSRSREDETNSSVHRTETGSKVFVDYILKYDKSYNVTYGPYTQCAIGVKANKWGRKKITRVGLSKPFTKILNVTTYLRTNLKIITVGDSVAMQFHEVLEEALHPTSPAAAAGVGLGVDHNETTYRTLYQYAWPGAELVSVTAPVNGGGALAALRMTGLFLEEGRGKPPPNIGPNQTDASGGWLPEHVRQILDHNYTMPSMRVTDGIETTATATTTTTTNSKTIESFDVMFFRIPHGWLPASSITRERLEASLRLMQRMFGVHTIIIQTIFLNVSWKPRFVITLFPIVRFGSLQFGFSRSLFCRSLVLSVAFFCWCRTT